MPTRIEPPYYPIVYVRGYAMTEGEREETFHDAYYGFSANSVESATSRPTRATSPSTSSRGSSSDS
jgi:hypothetical protein